MSDAREVSRSPTNAQWALAALLALVVGAAIVLRIDLSAVTTGDGLRAAWARVSEYLGAFAAPDLSAPMLARCARLAADTVAVALLGTALGLLLAYPLALLACRAVVLPEGPAPLLARAGARAVLEASRLALDALRGVPDFVWALVLANITGVNPVTGLLAIAVSVAGIFGKVISEQWDNVDPARYAALRSTGASRLEVFFYGLQPIGGRTTLSFVLMRTECAVRNASVIGVVGGGGLGAALWDEYTDGNWPAVATVLLVLLAVTATADLAANLVRQRLRTDPNHPRAPRVLDRHAAARRRTQVLVAIAVVLVACAVWLREPFARATGELGRIDAAFVRSYTLGLFTPSLDADTWWAVLRESIPPLAIAVLATVGGALLAALLVFPASLAFQLDSARILGERLPPWLRAARLALVLAARGLALVMRGVPEVAWLVVLAVFFRAGVTPCIAAVMLHTAGVLHRVFTEAVDDVPYGQLQAIGASRAKTLLYGALPRVRATWSSYAFFQFEVNMRAGIALGIVGAGGLGLYFKNNLAYRQHADAAAFLWGMVLLTVLVDRLSRWLRLRRLRC